MFVLFICLIRPFFANGVGVSLVKEICYGRKSQRQSLGGRRRMELRSGERFLWSRV